MSGTAADDPEDRDALAAEFVLGLLDAAAHRQVAEAAATDIALADAIAAWSARLNRWRIWRRLRSRATFCGAALPAILPRPARRPGQRVPPAMPPAGCWRPRPVSAWPLASRFLLCPGIASKFAWHWFRNRLLRRRKPAEMRNPFCRQSHIGCAGACIPSFQNVRPRAATFGSKTNLAAGACRPRPCAAQRARRRNTCHEGRGDGTGHRTRGGVAPG